MGDVHPSQVRMSPSFSQYNAQDSVSLLKIEKCVFGGKSSRYEGARSCRISPYNRRSRRADVRTTRTNIGECSPNQGVNCNKYSIGRVLSIDHAVSFF